MSVSKTLIKPGAYLVNHIKFVRYIEENISGDRVAYSQYDIAGEGEPGYIAGAGEGELGSSLRITTRKAMSQWALREATNEEIARIRFEAIESKRQGEEAAAKALVVEVPGIARKIAEIWTELTRA